MTAATMTAADIGACIWHCRCGHSGTAPDGATGMRAWRVHFVTCDTAPDDGVRWMRTLRGLENTMPPAPYPPGR